MLCLVLLLIVSSSIAEPRGHLARMNYPSHGSFGYGPYQQQWFRPPHTYHATKRLAPVPQTGRYQPPTSVYQPPTSVYQPPTSAYQLPVQVGVSNTAQSSLVNDLVRENIFSYLESFIMQYAILILDNIKVKGPCICGGECGVPTEGSEDERIRCDSCRVFSSYFFGAMFQATGQNLHGGSVLDVLRKQGMGYLDSEGLGKVLASSAELACNTIAADVESLSDEVDEMLGGVPTPLQKHPNPLRHVPEFRAYQQEKLKDLKLAMHNCENEQWQARLTCKGGVQVLNLIRSNINLISPYKDDFAMLKSASRKLWDDISGGGISPSSFRKALTNIGDVKPDSFLNGRRFLMTQICMNANIPANQCSLLDMAYLTPSSHRGGRSMTEPMFIMLQQVLERNLELVAAHSPSSFEEEPPYGPDGEPMFGGIPADDAQWLADNRDYINPALRAIGSVALSQVDGGAALLGDAVGYYDAFGNLAQGDPRLANGHVAEAVGGQVKGIAESCLDFFFKPDDPATLNAFGHQVHVGELYENGADKLSGRLGTAADRYTEEQLNSLYYQQQQQQQRDQQNRY